MKAFVPDASVTLVPFVTVNVGALFAANEKKFNIQKEIYE